MQENAPVSISLRDACTATLFPKEGKDIESVIKSIFVYIQKSR